MKIIMVAAVSKDEFITNGDNPDVSNWTSAEDKLFFSKIKSKHGFFVMGSKTYNTGTVLPKSGTLKIVLTSTPAKYKIYEIPGQLVFRNLNPKEFINLYEPNYKSCLLLGGGYTYEEFLSANLVDEIYLTVEPAVFGSGTPLLTCKKIDNYTKEIKPEITTLNSKGTKLLHYVLKK